MMKGGVASSIAIAQSQTTSSSNRRDSVKGRPGLIDRGARYGFSLALSRSLGMGGYCTATAHEPARKRRSRTIGTANDSEGGEMRSCVRRAEKSQGYR
jgi:hypothetical protein